MICIVTLEKKLIHYNTIQAHHRIKRNWGNNMK